MRVDEWAVARGGGRRRRGWLALLALIAVIGFAVRFAFAARGGGLTGIGAYDDGVYYAAADALVHGRLPYRDFLFLQPPGIAVAAAPFAALGVLTADPVGFVAARLAFMLVGGVNAALVSVSLRRFGLSAAAIGGFFYAVFFPAVYAERSVLLEPLGSMGVLLAIHLLQRPGCGRRWSVLAGIAAGAAIDVKIWYVVPAVVVGLFASGSRKPFWAGASAAVGAVYLPFVAAAPSASIREILLDQLGRPRSSVSLLKRMAQALGARAYGGVDVRTVTAFLVAAALAITVAAAVTRGARLFAALLAANALVLLASPSWFLHYSALTAPPLALCLGVAFARLAALARRRGLRLALVAVVLLAIVATNEGQDRRRAGVPVPMVVAVAGSAVHGCVLADDPTVLAQMNVLSRDLSDPHCVVRPDLTGYTYDRDLVRADASVIGLPRNPRWQRDAVRYLESGTAVILVRRDIGLAASTREAVEDGQVLARSGPFVLRSVPLSDRAGA